MLDTASISINPALGIIGGEALVVLVHNICWFTFQKIFNIFHKDGSILVEKRKQTRKIDPGKIVIPGGHVEQGEPLEQACKRELKEELNIDCKKFFLIEKLLHHTPIEEQMHYYYLCQDWKGVPQCNEAEQIFWIDRNQLTKLDLEIDKKVIEEFFKRRA